MEEIFREIAIRVAMSVELLAALIIAYGAIEALLILLITKSGRAIGKPFLKQRRVFLRFGVWLVLALEFELAADVVRSAISPGWKEIGQLAAIAGIRTVLNYFLERDIDKLSDSTIEDIGKLRGEPEMG